MTNEELKYLEFIQNIITRMNSNSFYIKNWSITIISAFIAIFASTKDNSFILFSMIPTIVFWLLDSYYLNLERKYRKLYNEITGVNEGKSNRTVFDMSIQEYKSSFWKTFFSFTIMILYFTMLLLLITLYLIV